MHYILCIGLAECFVGRPVSELAFFGTIVRETAATATPELARLLSTKKAHCVSGLGFVPRSILGKA